MEEHFDVIVSDIGMPETDGYAFITELRTRGIAQWGGRTAPFEQAPPDALRTLGSERPHV